MQSDTPLRQESPIPRRPSTTDRRPPAPDQSFPALEPHDPRTRAALCYAFPLLPGLYLLWRERFDRFVRLHAAQSVVFFGLLAIAQTLLFIAAIIAGNLAPLGWTLTALGLLFWALFIALGLSGFVLWLRMLNDCVHGRTPRRALLAPLTQRLEAFTLRFARSASGAYHGRRNGER